MTPTMDPERVAVLAPTDTTEALALARRISDPWFRCQALANVSRYATASLIVAIALEAFQAAREQKDPYKVVAVSAWPVRALIERDQTAELSLWLPELVELSRRIEHPVSRRFHSTSRRQMQCLTNS